MINAEDNIVIEPYNPAWPKLSAAEMKAIRLAANQSPYIAIEHIGSTRTCLHFYYSCHKCLICCDPLLTYTDVLS